ncbi:hypothetical protein [Cryobacterium tagatosivorans]|uniref:Uncharacterized protein n=1 Tax=Cryobacterium tagatosivorans TaxID=1259199 RepID=A0A4V3I661_9MICO|nr:hypothetical protein [Cryobacterium tagatosivorans]TFB47575.1 hypothetical protein E3O23_14935 [Cryobacterium tagatosivorans]
MHRLPRKVIHGGSADDELVSVSAMLDWEEHYAPSPRYHRVNGDRLFHRTSTEEFISVLRVLIWFTTSRPGTFAAA